MNYYNSLPPTIKLQQQHGLILKQFEFKGWDQYNSICESEDSWIDECTGEKFHYSCCQLNSCHSKIYMGYPFYERCLELIYYDPNLVNGKKILEKHSKFCSKRCYLLDKEAFDIAQTYYNTLDITDSFKKFNI